jgi:molecular chaperone GrpE (heat shock protein)
MTENEAPNVSPAATVSGIEEIADDMLHLLERVAALEQRLAEQTARIEQVGQLVGEAHLNLGRSIEVLRRELLEERKAIVNGAAVQAITSGIVPLRTVARTLDPTTDAGVLGQVAAVLGSLGGMLQTLGIREFEPVVGERFDPARMECIGYTEGERGFVLGVCSPGYLAGDRVVRPAGVLIADPSKLLA